MIKKISLIFCGLFLVGCSQTIYHKKSDKHGVTIYLTEDVDVPSYFQSHVIIVGQITKKLDKDNSVGITYPSINKGPSPMYSHTIEVNIPDGMPLEIPELVKSGKLAILRSTGEKFKWDLVGFVSPNETEFLFDWFSNKYLYTFQKPLGDEVKHECCIEEKSGF